MGPQESHLEGKINLTDAISSKNERFSLSSFICASIKFLWMWKLIENRKNWISKQIAWPNKCLVISTLRPEQNDCHFANDNFNLIKKSFINCFTEICSQSFTWHYVSLVQVVGRCLFGTKPCSLYQRWLRLLIPNKNTWLQWIRPCYLI